MCNWLYIVASTCGSAVLTDEHDYSTGGQQTEKRESRYVPGRMQHVFKGEGAFVEHLYVGIQTCGRDDCGWANVDHYHKMEDIIRAWELDNEPWHKVYDANEVADAIPISELPENLLKTYPNALVAFSEGRCQYCGCRPPPSPPPPRCRANGPNGAGNGANGSNGAGNGAGGTNEAH